MHCRRSTSRRKDPYPLITMHILASLQRRRRCVPSQPSLIDLHSSRMFLFCLRHLCQQSIDDTHLQDNADFTGLTTGDTDMVDLLCITVPAMHKAAARKTARPSRIGEKKHQVCNYDFVQLENMLTIQFQSWWIDCQLIFAGRCG
jgi:hypothetical protein